jgi:UDP-2,3-diacylglucosamine hydrolase
MKTIFLADAHLKGTGDPAQEKLLGFLDRFRGKGETGGGQGAADPPPADAVIVDQLVIVGDFFDFWFAKGERVYPGFRPVIERLTVLQKRGVRISLCEGNHDFFLADYFTQKMGIEVYPEWAELEMDGLKVLVSHGDTIDRANRKYLALRNFLRSPFARCLQRLLPLPLLWGTARISSSMSKGMSGQSRDRLAEVMHAFALGKFTEGYDAVILGHCHKPLLRQSGGEGSKTFATLGDWDTGRTYLLYDSGRFTLNRFDQG